MRAAIFILFSLLCGAGAAAQVPFDGRFAALQMSADANPVFLAGTVDGLYRSVDEQQTWTPIHFTDDFRLDQPAVPQIELDSFRGSTFYARTPEPGLAVLRSDDSGLTWTPKTSGLPRDGVAEDLFVIRTVQGLLYASIRADGELRAYKSTDRGDTWSPLRTLPDGADSIEIHARNPDLWYYETGRGIFRSLDEGATFSSTGPFPVARCDTCGLQNGVSALKTNPNSETALLLGTGGPVFGDEQFVNGYFFSNDLGSNWTRVFNAQVSSIDADRGLVLIYNGTASTVWVSRDGGRTVGEAVDIAPGIAGVSAPFLLDRRDTGVIYAGPRRSTDGGESWTLEAGVAGFFFGTDETAIELSGSTQDVAPQVQRIEVGVIGFPSLDTPFTLETSEPWVDVQPGQGNGRTAIAVRAFPGGLPVGVQEATITVRAPEAENPEFEIPVRLDVTADPAAPPSPVIMTIAGDGDFDDEGDDGSALAASFEGPRGITFDAAGNLYVSDNFASRVRRISPDGVVTAFAGSRVEGFAGDGGPAVDAQLDSPVDVAAGPDGEVYIADRFDRRVRVVTPEGVIHTFAGNGEISGSFEATGLIADLGLSPQAVTAGEDGSVYVAGFGVHRLLPSGTFLRWSRMSFEDIALGADGELYGVTDTTLERIRPNLLTRIAGGDEAGFTGDGGPARDARFDGLTALAIDQDGQFFLADSDNQVIRRIDENGIVSTYAGVGVGGFSGDGGPANQAEIKDPEGLAIGPDGALYIAGDRRIRKVSAPGSTPAPVLTSAGVVSAASFVNSAVAPEQIVSIFGANLAPEVAAATSTPLPTTLAGVRLELIDSAGSAHAARLFFVAPGQINALVPGAAALGPATLRFFGADGQEALASIEVQRVRPGLFSANASGEGVAAAAAVRIAADGTQSAVEVLQGSAPVEGAPIDLGPEGDQVVLLLFGTGLRGFEGSIQATIGGLPAQVVGIAAQGQFAGLDQINVILPRELSGRGEVEFRVTIDGQDANVVTVVIG